MTLLSSRKDYYEKEDKRGNNQGQEHYQGKIKS